MISSVTSTVTLTATEELVANATSTSMSTVTVDPACLESNDQTSFSAFHRCAYNVFCDTAGVYHSGSVSLSSLGTKLTDCIASCDNDAICGAVNFDRSTNLCTLIELSDLTITGINSYITAPDIDVDFAVLDTSYGC